MDVVVDTSVILAVVTNEPHKKQLVALTKGSRLLAPSSIHWEVGNAFSAMFKRKRITFEQALQAMTTYRSIPLALLYVDLVAALELAHDLNVYAYDAYVLECARSNECPIVTLDKGLRDTARQLGITVLEISP